MKTKYPSMFGVLAALLLVVSFIIPTNLASPSPVQAAVCSWSSIDMPGSNVARGDIVNGSEVNKLVVGNDGTTVLAVVTLDAGLGIGVPMLFNSGFMGLMWGTTAYGNLTTAAGATTGTAFIFDVAIAPDNPAFWVVVTGVEAATFQPLEVWITENAGGKWECTNLATATPGADRVGAIDISVDYGGERDVAVGIRRGDGSGAIDIYVLQTAGFTGWVHQSNTVAPVTGNGDVFALKFSPSYPADGSLAVVYANAAGTWYNVALRDIDANNVLSWAFATSSVEVGDPADPNSPLATELVSADLELPSDFSGQAASLRRAYIATDAGNSTSLVGCTAATPRDDGIFRIDDTTVYILMDTSAPSDTRRISSIAYFGTYASGKMLAGEYLGFACTATVPTWFTDSPTTCPVPCWYPCLKCPTGAACQDVCNTPDVCALGTRGVGNAQVLWWLDGQVGLAATGSSVSNNGTAWFAGVLALPIADDESAISLSRNNGETWNQIAFIDTTIDYFNDFASSADCNTLYLASANECGATSLCTALVLVTCDNTTEPTSCHIAATATDVNCACGDNETVTITSATCGYDEDLCACVYYISGHFNYRCTCPPFCTQSCSFGPITGTVDCADSENITVSCACDCSPCCGTETNEGCCCFDSVWRSSLNPAVVSPLPPIPPIGVWYERVYTRVTALNCTEEQSDLPLLRLAGACEEPTGQIVGWAAQGTQAQAWSPDYGDYWAIITARDIIQDFAFESSTILYNLYIGGSVQKLPYTGTAWATTLPSVNTGNSPGHTIAAMPEGQLLVGYGTGATFPAFISKDGGASFTPLLQSLAGQGDIHVAFDPAYNDNSIIYIGDTGTDMVYRMNVAGAPLTSRWADSRLMDPSNGAVGCPSPSTVGGIYGLALAYTGAAAYGGMSALYAADFHVAEQVSDSGVWRTLTPLSGLPKPGIAWDRLTTGLSTGVQFTAEPYSLKLCGCCTVDTDTTIYALDYRDYIPTVQGMLWAFTDCMAKKGPALITADKTLIGCDPVSGRAGEVNLCWEQLCVAMAYDLEISKNPEFNILVIDWVGEPVCCGAFAAGFPGCWVPDSLLAPCAYFPAGGGVTGAGTSAIAFSGNLECGHTYYWRVKVRACITGQQIRSPWSETRSFLVKAGLPVVASYQGLQLLAPANGSMGIPVKSPSFSWSPLGENTKYKFVLAKDAAMTQVVTEAEVTGTAFAYDGTLDYSTNYFWKVSCIDPACDASATFSFQTAGAPAEEAPVKPAPTPVWVWVVIAIGAILVIVTLVLIFKTRRV